MYSVKISLLLYCCEQRDVHMCLNCMISWKRVATVELEKQERKKRSAYLCKLLENDCVNNLLQSGVW